MHVLIADDDPVYRALLRSLLEHWKCDVTVTSDGREAWERIRSDDSIDLVLLDWMMPEMDGYEVCRSIRQSNDLRGVYILMLTGSRQKEEIVKVLVAGADDYLIKPFEPQDLQIRIRAAKRIIDLQQELADLRRRTTQTAKATA